MHKRAWTQGTLPEWLLWSCLSLCWMREKIIEDFQKSILISQDDESEDRCDVFEEWVSLQTETAPSVSGTRCTLRLGRIQLDWTHWERSWNDMGYTWLILALLTARCLQRQCSILEVCNRDIVKHGSFEGRDKNKVVLISDLVFPSISSLKVSCWNDSKATSWENQPVVVWVTIAQQTMPNHRGLHAVCVRQILSKTNYDWL